MPSVAARNKLKYPWDDIPKKLLKMNEVENGVVAPSIIFANIHNMRAKITDVKKIIAIPVVVDRADNPSAIISTTNNFNLKNVREVVRLPIVDSAFRRLTDNIGNP